MLSAIDSQSLVRPSPLGHAYARGGMKDKARATLTQLMQASRDRHVSAYHVAAIHLVRGEVSAALESLNRAYEEKSPWIGYLRVDPRFRRLNDDPHSATIRKAHLDNQ